MGARRGARARVPAAPTASARAHTVSLSGCRPLSLPIRRTSADNPSSWLAGRLITDRTCSTAGARANLCPNFAPVRPKNPPPQPWRGLGDGAAASANGFRAVAAAVPLSPPLLPLSQPPPPPPPLPPLPGPFPAPPEYRKQPNWPHKARLASGMQQQIDLPLMVGLARLLFPLLASYFPAPERKQPNGRPAG